MGDALCLLQQTGPGRFEDVTGLAGLEGLTARSGAWVDYDHDGDVDLLLGGSGGLQLWQNNGDRRFTNVTHLAGLTNAIEVQDVAVADLDRDVAMDLE